MKKILPLIIIMICIAQRNVSAYDMRYSPSLDVAITWNDNIEDASTDEREDFIFGATPRIDIRGRGDRSNFRLIGRMTGTVYNKFEEFNEITDYRVNSNFNYDPSKNLRFRLPASFLFAPSVESATEILELGIEEGGVPETVEIVRRTDRYRVYAGPSFSYEFTERVSSRLRGEFRTVQYTEDIAGITDSVTYSADGGLSYEYTRKTTGSINVSFDDNDFDRGNDSNVYSSNLSVRHLYNRNLTLSASGGVSYISIDTRESSFDIIGSVDGRLRVKRASYRVIFNRDVQGSSFGNTNTRDRLKGFFEIPLSRKVKFYLDGEVSRYKSSDGDQNLLIKRTSGLIEYQPLQHLTLFIRGSHEDQDERAFAGQDVRVNRVSAGFTLWANIEGRSINE